MPSLEKLLLPDEKLMFHTHKSLIIFFYPLLWVVVTFIIYRLEVPFLSGLELPLIGRITNFAWVPALIALWSWLNQLVLYLSSQFYVTNRRIIMREGFFFRHATETRLSAIAEIRVDQPLLGQIMDFGNISINSFGSGSEVFNQIAAPYRFQRFASEALDQSGKAR